MVGLRQLNYVKANDCMRLCLDASSLNLYYLDQLALCVDVELYHTWLSGLLLLSRSLGLLLGSNRISKWIGRLLLDLKDHFCEA